MRAHFPVHFMRPALLLMLISKIEKHIMEEKKGDIYRLISLVNRGKNIHNKTLTN